MIEINQNGSKVKVIINPNLYSEKVIVVYFECGDEVYSELLSLKIRNALHKELQDIRKDEYDAAWRDAKAKKAKRTWFAGTFNWRNK